MGLYRDARRVLLHTGIVVSLSVLILKTLLGHRSCQLSTIERQIANVQRWHKSNTETLLDLQEMPGDLPTDDAVERLLTSSELSKVVTKELGSAQYPNVPGKEDVLYIIKTGATEALDRLPIHVKTTLQCWPNYMVFSDFAEEIDKITLHDALDDIDLGIRLHHPDFDIWRRLHAGGRQNLTAKDFSGSSTNEVSSKVGGALSNPGWKIDKYKNLPMVEKARHQHSNLKWYIFTDADTFMSPTNLMTWLSKLDHTKPLYLGNPSMIGSQTFGHGGSGYILSAPAMEVVAKKYSEERGYWENFAAQNWAGDHVFGTMLQKRLGIPLTWSYPLLQAESPFALDFMENKYSRKLWCYPAVSYHHASPATIEALWELERRWARTHSSQEPMRHRDVYQLLVEPRLGVSDGQDWDNLSEDTVEARDGADGDKCRKTLLVPKEHMPHFCNSQIRQAKQRGHGIRLAY
ncbi:hypothetical protein PRZ48_004183 [Zasmidium cellare]|uniref:N-acetylgalactosaminide beta-1,3-galactosyltransferase n=1 Tax=Zasmidium cellare TaxID=395010 RepID=A0ABR0EYQ9_ZASCE|nr:hypothetical protein PRZ48_004183 [Zasmidium cellare]